MKITAISGAEIVIENLQLAMRQADDDRHSVTLMQNIRYWMINNNHTGRIWIINW